MTGSAPVDWPRIAGELRRLAETGRQLSAAINSPGLRARLRLVGWMLQRFEDAKRNPDHRKARRWLKLSGWTPREIAELMDFLEMEPDELLIPRLRGKRRAADVAVLVKQLAKRIKRTGELPTTAARRVLEAHGYRGKLKGRADYLVRLWNDRALYSK